MASAKFEKLLLSASVDGLQILVSSIASPGTLIHTAINSLTIFDEVYLYATNNHTASANLMLLWGGTASKDYKQMAIDSKKGDFLIVPGHIIRNAKEIRAFSDVANVISISGWVNRITPPTS